MARLILLLLLALLAAVAAAAPPPVVSLTAGRVSGACWATACAYRAVPYAAPPTRDNRWRPPQPAPPWRGVRDGSRPGRACVQTPLDESSPQSEDCLHADVYVPKAKAKAKAKKAKGLPVLVFFYGGGMLSGANAWYNLSSFVRGGDGDGGGEDFVVVAPNYRLGPLGWLALKELSAEKGAGGASGNYGLMDAQASLRWVAANIGAFGGDPVHAGSLQQCEFLLSDPCFSSVSNLRLASPSWDSPAAPPCSTACSRTCSPSKLPRLRCSRRRSCSRPARTCPCPWSRPRRRYIPVCRFLK